MMVKNGCCIAPIFIDSIYKVIRTLGREKARKCDVIIIIILACI